MHSHLIMYKIKFGRLFSVSFGTLCLTAVLVFTYYDMNYESNHHTLFIRLQNNITMATSSAFNATRFPNLEAMLDLTTERGKNSGPRQDNGLNSEGQARIQSLEQHLGLANEHGNGSTPAGLINTLTSGGQARIRSLEATLGRTTERGNGSAPGLDNILTSEGQAKIPSFGAILGLTTERKGNGTALELGNILTSDDRGPNYSLTSLMSATGSGSVRPAPLDIMSLEPFKFLENYKNPCVFSKGNELNCLPYFYVVGAPKAGTTDLFRRLVMHPEISELVPKDSNWISRVRFYKNPLYHPLSAYFDIFSRATADIACGNKSSYHSKIFGDFSASTLWDNDHWDQFVENRNQTEPRCTNADVIHHLNPDARIITILRNPIDRLYSEYLYFGKQLKDRRIFHAGVTKIVQYYTKCFASHSVRQCLYRPEPAYLLKYGRIRLRVGTYHIYLEDYFRVFPKDQMLVLEMEEYSRNLTLALDKVASFLKLSPMPLLSPLANMTYANRHYNSNDHVRSEVGDMLPETRKLLHEFYKPFNDKLTDLIGMQFHD